ncbi:hypothetical protein DSAG12_03406 [Promethearchaeum syntrophicum]|uniref:Uncharacterized protein n=1 Tax=Promethearchaeum syntrophicum TaxID=2594042 RepID=A0A5B9DE26_9ARCH|nr:hypothetical protein [Candidatus Prometheoarchaeum syntrophicum]QEE17569.1 hypothetical protein DSAG12_03406 [Candidatus Prometheoarchaeum syntrophicum]
MILSYQEELQIKYQKIKKFIKELSNLNGRKEKLMEIYFWLITYPYLTQAELQILTGYSLGTISESLKSLLVVSSVKLRTRKNTSESEYYLTYTKTSLDYTLSSRSKSVVVNICEFMENLLTSMKKHNTTKNDLLMLENLQDFNHYYLWVKQSIAGEENSYNPFSLEKKQERILNPDFSPQYERFEKNFIDFFVKQQIFEEMTEKNSIVLGFFITRGNLTISMISKLVPFSIGTVSNCVHYLESLHFIQKNDGKYGYNLYSFGVGWLNYRKYYYERMRFWQKDFSKMKMELENSLQDYHFIPQIGPFLIFLNRLLKTLERAQIYYNENDKLWKTALEFSIKHSLYYPSISKNNLN